MKRVLSGIKPSGDITLGNYLGAMRRWAREQDGRENFYFIPNLHALNGRPDPDTLKHNSLAAASWLLAMGVDTAKSSIFMQSQVSAHSELMWILTNFVTMGELNRMTQFKDKASKAGSEGQLVALYAYPVLMAADILLYDADEVPVGEDQKQHVELTRDIATRFNNLYGPVFKVPTPTIGENGARIMDLQDPTKKMSKSDADASGCILLSDSPQLIEQKIMRAVTDSGSIVQALGDKPAITNLLTILSLVTDTSVADLEQTYAGKGYGDFKRGVAEAVLAELEPVQENYRKIFSEQSMLPALEDGRQKASMLATAKLQEVKAALGIL